MSKQSGLGDALYVAGFNASGDVQQLGAIGGGPALLDVTGIDKGAYERIGGLRDGRFEMTTFFNHVAVTGGTHEKLSALPRADVILTYCRGTALGNPAASIVARQINYDPTRGNDGALTFGVSAQSNAYGIEWGQQLTSGIRTDATAANGTAIDTTAPASFGGQAYLQVFAPFSGTDATVKIQDSADNVTFADVTGLAFTQIASAPTSQRIATASGATIRRYVRAVTVTTGGFSSLSFAVNFVKNQVTTNF